MKKNISARVFCRKNLRIKNTENTEKRIVIIGMRTLGFIIISLKVCGRSLERYARSPMKQKMNIAENMLKQVMIIFRLLSTAIV